MRLLSIVLVAGCASSIDHRAAVTHVARARSSALVARDAAALTSILDERFVYTNASGERMDREGYLARYVRSPDVTWHDQELEDVEVALHGDTAILTGRVHDRATFAGQDLDAWFRTTFVYVRSGDRWRCVAGHTSGNGLR